jgi:hypothetical protein
VVVAVVDGKATSGLPDKSIQKLFASARVARRACPRTLVRYAIGRVFLDGTDARPEPIRLEIRSDRPSENLMFAIMMVRNRYCVYRHVHLQHVRERLYPGLKHCCWG